MRLVAQLLGLLLNHALDERRDLGLECLQHVEVSGEQRLAQRVDQHAVQPLRQLCVLRSNNKYKPIVTFRTTAGLL